MLQQVANALRISVESLYVRAGILPDEERGVSTVSEAIEHDPDLTPGTEVGVAERVREFPRELSDRTSVGVGPPTGRRRTRPPDEPSAVPGSVG